MKCRIAIFLFFVFCALSWGQELPPESDTASVPDSAPTQLPLSQQLRSLATTLEQATTDSATDWEEWSLAWTNHLRKLEGLADLSRESELEKESMKKSLDNYDSSLKDSIAREAAARREAGFFKVTTAVGIGVAVVAALVAALK